jgi:HD-like signal output (HDOD) protein
MEGAKQQTRRPSSGIDAAVDSFARAALAKFERGDDQLVVWSNDVRRVLEELATPKPSTARLSQLMALDARLAMTVMQVAQSAVFDRIAAPNLDLQGTIFALGPERLRSIVLGAAIARLPEQPRLQLRRQEVQSIGDYSLRVSAICMLAAQRIGGTEVVEAFLLGMLHAVGKFCLYARLSSEGEWQEDIQQRTLLMTRWHARFGGAAVRSWGLPTWLAKAVETQDQLGCEDHFDARCELLAAAVVAARTEAADDDTASHLAEFSRVGLDRDGWSAVLAGVSSTSSSLRSLLYN